MSVSRQSGVGARTRLATGWRCDTRNSNHVVVDRLQHEAVRELCQVGGSDSFRVLTWTGML